MLQRIQTVYLFVTLILTVLLLILPMGYMLRDGVEEVFKLNAVGAYGLTKDPATSVMTSQLTSGAWAMFVLVCLLMGSIVFDIILFKKRILQIRVAIFNMMIHLGLYAMFALYYFFLMPNQGVIAGTFSPSFAIIFPIINVILTYLAIRAIGADEALIRSLDRLR